MCESPVSFCFIRQIQLVHAAYFPAKSIKIGDGTALYEKCVPSPTLFRPNDLSVEPLKNTAASHDNYGTFTFSFPVTPSSTAASARSVGGAQVRHIRLLSPDDTQPAAR
jgi:hypothetical protein